MNNMPVADFAWPTRVVVPTLPVRTGGTASTQEWSTLWTVNQWGATSSLGYEWEPNLGMRLAVDSVIRTAIERIELLANYAQSGEASWDAISPKTVEAAKALISRVYRVVYEQGLAWMDPHVGSDGEGSVSFEWWQGKSSLTLYAYADGSSETLFARGANPVNEMESGNNPTDAQILALWTRLVESE